MSRVDYPPRNPVWHAPANEMQAVDHPHNPGWPPKIARSNNERSWLCLEARLNVAEAEVLLYSECDKILMVHLRSIRNDEVSMILWPIRVLRHEGRITANAPSASIQRLAPLHGMSGSYVNWFRTQAAWICFCTRFLGFSLVYT